jgi:hypothetical protein
MVNFLVRELYNQPDSHQGDLEETITQSATSIRSQSESQFSKLDLSFSRRFLWRIRFCALYRPIIRRETDVSVERTASIFKIQGWAKEKTNTSSQQAEMNCACRLFLLVPCFAYWTLKMEAEGSSKNVRSSWKL